MPSNAAYTVDDDDDEKHKRQWARTFVPVKVHAYDDAIDLAGNGWYSVSLLAVLSIANLSMAVEIFGISVILTGAHCEYTLDLNQTGILFAITFIGPIVMAYPWGYLSDTKGRKKCLLISLWTSFVFSTAGAFSPNWITIGVLKLFSTSFISCAQSATYTLLGESCPKRMRDAYMLVMTSVLDLSLAFYLGVAYLILNLDFSYDIGFISFTPWRLLAIVLALPIGIAAFGLHFFYESPRFLHNVGKREEAMDALREICRRNGGDVTNYPVKQIFLNEDGNQRPEGISVLRSLWEQIVPLFKPPLLWRSLQLYFITLVVYGTNNSYFMWFPVLAEHFVKGLSSDYNESPGLCNVIVEAYKNSTDTTFKECSSRIDIGSFYTSLIQGLSFVLVLLSVTRIAHRKRLLIIIILSISGFSAILAVVVKENITSLIMMFGFLINELVIGVIFSYYVDLYPTSYRGTAACLGTMVARASALSGVYLLGAFIMSHCDITFYFCAVLTFCGVLVSLLLPPDSPRKK